MKAISVTLAMLLTINSFAFAGSDRDSQLIELAQSKNPRAALSQMSEAELLQVRSELKQMLIDLQADFATASAKDGEKLGYKVRKWGAISAATLAVLSLSGLASGSFAKSAAYENGAFIILLLGVVGTAGAVVTTATGQAMIWLTPGEVDKVNQKIAQIAKLANVIDGKLNR